MFNQIIVLSLVVTCSFGQDYQREILYLPEGSKCRWSGLDGKCVNILNCQSATNVSRGFQPICSYQDGDIPIVCCTNCLPNYNIMVDARFGQPGSKARNYCLRYLTTLNYPCELENNCDGYVVPYSEVGAAGSSSLSSTQNKSELITPYVLSLSGGASSALRNQYPHMALLGYGDDIESAEWLCGGSVISEKYILTAAQCISNAAFGSVTFIRLGILRRSDPSEFWQTHKVKRVITHPEYRPPSKYNDIALLETEKPISFSDNVLPACLPLVWDTDETAEVTGWGALGPDSELADTLQTVELQRFNEEKCSQLYPKHKYLHEGYDHSSQMCYGDEEAPKGICEGDSGGPLQTKNEFARCAYTIIGVTSYGNECGTSAGSGVFTRVFPYVPWIESIVWP